MAVYWGEKRYHSLDYYLKNTYGSKFTTPFPARCRES